MKFIRQPKMKATKENIEILKLLGFSCDYERTKNPEDKNWYSLKNGWGFRLDNQISFESLILELLYYNPDARAYSIGIWYFCRKFKLSYIF